MKLSAVITSRNDSYGGNLIERSSYCFNSMIDTFDEVYYIDWNSPTQSLLYEVKNNVKFKGNLHHIIIEPRVASYLTNNNPDAQKCCEVLSRNIGLRRATGDWVTSTNIDIIAPKRDQLLNVLSTLDRNTFYTVSRRPLELSIIQNFNVASGFPEYTHWEEVRDYCIKHSEQRHYAEKTVGGDEFSLINCCGDFQIAPRHIWDEIRGMEEDLIYPLYADTNVQKKAIMHGFKLKALYEPALFHINHGKGGGGFCDGINKKGNDVFRAILSQEKTRNDETWGFSDTEIEYELL